jgi:DNA-binding NtrC family response regulator
VERALATDGPMAAPAGAAAPLDLPLDLSLDTPVDGHPADTSLRSVEHAALRAQLKAHRGSRAELARKLGISERSLYRKLHALAVEPPAQ